MKRSLAIAVLLSMAPGAALAEVTLADAPAPASSTHSDNPRFGFELRFGPYRPHVGSDEERDYYKLIYASGDDDSMFEHRPMMKTLEIDTYLSDSFGLLGLAFTFGHWRTEGPTRECDSPEGCTPETVGESTPGTDVTALTIYPVGLALVYRFDLLKRRNSAFVLVPYAKAGIDYYIWRNTVRGEVSEGEMGRGTGGTLGARGTLGLSLNLDWIEPDAASRARGATGLADSYLFLEGSWLWADGFGDTTRFDMSAFLVQLGVAIDFL